MRFTGIYPLSIRHDYIIPIDNLTSICVEQQFSRFIANRSRR